MHLAEPRSVAAGERQFDTTLLVGVGRDEARYLPVSSAPRGDDRTFRAASPSRFAEPVREVTVGHVPGLTDEDDRAAVSRSGWWRVGSRCRAIPRNRAESET